MVYKYITAKDLRVVCCRHQKPWILYPLTADASLSFLLLALETVPLRVFCLVKWLLQMERLVDDDLCFRFKS